MKIKDRFFFRFIVFIVLIGVVSGCADAEGVQQGTAEYTTSLSATASLKAGAQETVSPVPDTQEESAADLPADSEETAVPTSSPPATAVSKITSVPCALTPPAENGWPVVLCETFDDNQNDWTIESQDNPYARYDIKIEGGKYALDYTAKGFAKFQQSAVTWFDVASMDDFALSVTTLMNSDFQNCSWGLAFRADDDSFFPYLYLQRQHLCL